VRELQNRIQRATLVSSHEEITPLDLGLADLDSGSSFAQGHAPLDGGERTHEANEIEDALSRASGVISRAAADLGMSRQALYRRMARLGISVERRMTSR
jgi:DNA-binding NtrC family response regulator